MGFEPTTLGSTARCSTAELRSPHVGLQKVYHTWHGITFSSFRRYLFSEISTEARVVSQSKYMVQLAPAWSNATVKFSTGEGSFVTFMLTRARSSLAPG